MKYGRGPNDLMQKVETNKQTDISQSCFFFLRSVSKWKSLTGREGETNWNTGVPVTTATICGASSR